MPVSLATTTNNAFRFPNSSNNGSDFATGINDLATDVDTMWRAGTLASRPAAAAVPRSAVYYGTDTKLLYESDGTSWFTVMVSGAWANLTLATGWISGGGLSPSARMVGDMLQLKGGIQNTTGGTVAPGTTIATMPAAITAPAGTLQVAAFGGTGLGQLGITPAKTLSFSVAITNTQTLFLDGISCAIV